MTEREPDGLIISKEPTGRYRVRQYIKEIQVSRRDNKTIIGGRTNNGDEFKEIMKWLYKGSKEDKLEIAWTSLSDGKLDVGEYIDFEDIFDHYDIYNTYWSIGLPIGAIFAGIAVACGAPLEFAEALARFYVSFSYNVLAAHYITGAIENLGSEEEGGNDVSLIVYIRLSRYRYNVDGYTFNVPAGIMFRIEPYSSSSSPLPPPTLIPYNLP